MNKIVEIVFGNSLNFTMKKSKLNKNEIIMFNTLFSISNLSSINEYKLITKEEINPFDGYYSFKEEIELLTKHINNNDKIRIWSSHKDIEPFLLLLFICDNFKDKELNLYVTYSEELNDCPSPACLSESELEELSKHDQKLTKEEIQDYSNKWQEIVKINSPLRVIENGKVLSVDLHYFDNYILNKLKESGTITISRLTAEMLAEYHIQDLQIVYFIDELIKENKIKIVEKSTERHFKDKIEIVL